MIRAFHLQIYPTKRQEKALRQHCIATRILYNETIRLWQDRYFRAQAFKGMMGKSIYQYRKEKVEAGDATYLEIKKKFDKKTGIEKEQRVVRMLSKPTYTDFSEKFPWMKELSSVIRRDAVIDANDAFEKFFKGLAKYPRFKKRSSALKCRTAQGDAVSLLGENGFADRLKLPRTDPIKLSRDNYVPLSHKLIQAAVSQKAGKWFISISMHLPDEEKPELQGRTGIDLGCRTLIASAVKGTDEKRGFSYSTEQTTQLEKLGRQKSKWNKALARRFQKGAEKQSQGWFEAKEKLQAIYLKISNLQKDIINKITSRVSSSNSESIVIEDLKVKNMMQNQKLSPILQKTALGETKRQLIYKAKSKGTKVLRVSAFFPSSQTCPSCGNIKGRNGTKKLGSKKIYRCEKCGFIGDRDIEVAAVNLANAPEEVLTEV